MNYYAKLAEKKNSVVDKGTIRGKRYEIVKLSSISYIGYIYDSEGDRVYKTGIYSNPEDCKKAIETNDGAFNSKEKTNNTVARGTVHGHKYEVDRMSDGSYMGYVYDEDDYPIFKTGLHSTAAGAEKEIKSKVFNSKENSMNYYEKIIQEKQNSTFKYLGKSFVVNKDNYKYVKAQVEQTYKDRIAYLEEKKRSAQSTEKAAIETEIRDIKAGFRETLESLKWGAEWDNSKEESYYAKLSEKKNLTYDTEKLAKQVKTWLSTGAYDEREIADKLEKEYGMPKSVASHTLEMGKRLRAQG